MPINFRLTKIKEKLNIGLFELDPEYIYIECLKGVVASLFFVVGRMRRSANNTGHHAVVYVCCIVCLLFAASAPAVGWHGELSVLSDYVYRGYSKNRGHPLVQGHLDYEDDLGWFTGFGISQVSFDDRVNADHSDLEVKPYVGWGLSLTEDWKTDLSAVAYIYNDKVFGRNADYAEFYASLHYQDWLSALVSVAPNAYQRHTTVLNYEANYRRDISDSVRFSAGLGFQQAKQLLELQQEGYFYWNAGVSWFVTPYLSLDLRYVDVNLNQPGGLVLDDGDGADEFYPRLIESKYLLSITLGF
jgi:uncharacterized protein (TIGR02001 family)